MTSLSVDMITHRAGPLRAATAARRCERCRTGHAPAELPLNSERSGRGRQRNNRPAGRLRPAEVQKERRRLAVRKEQLCLADQKGRRASSRTGREDSPAPRARATNQTSPFCTRARPPTTARAWRHSRARRSILSATSICRRASLSDADGDGGSGGGSVLCVVLTARQARRIKSIRSGGRGKPCARHAAVLALRFG